MLSEITLDAMTHTWPRLARLNLPRYKHYGQLDALPYPFLQNLSIISQLEPRIHGSNESILETVYYRKSARSASTTPEVKVCDIVELGLCGYL